MIKIKDKITKIMDEIQIIMESNGHLNGEIEKLEELFSKVSIYWAHMDDGDKDYIDGAKTAIEDKIKWEINK